MTAYLLMSALIVIAVSALFWFTEGGPPPAARAEIALVLGFLFVALLSIGLMGAMFWSNRSGRDRETYTLRPDGKDDTA